MVEPVGVPPPAQDDLAGGPGDPAAPGGEGAAAVDQGGSGPQVAAPEDPDAYPAWVGTDPTRRRRWDYSLQLADALFHDDGELGRGPTSTPSGDVVMAAASIFSSNIPTGDPPESVKRGHPLATRRPPEAASPGQDTAAGQQQDSLLTPDSTSGRPALEEPPPNSTVAAPDSTVPPPAAG